MADFAALAHGGSGLWMAYGAVQAPLLAGLIRGRASLGKIMLSPLIAVPLTIGAGIATAAVEPWLHAAGVAAGSGLQLGAGALLSAGIGYLSGRFLALSEPEGASKLQRGTVIAAQGAPLVTDEARLSLGLGLEGPSGVLARGADREITIAGVCIPFADETKHFKMIGTTGTGKSTAIQEILGAALARGDRAVIADPDGGYLRRFYDASRGDVILNPFEARSVKWDLFGEIDTNYDIEQLARSLIPDHEGSDRSWRSYARTFFTAVTRQARDAGIKDVGSLYQLLVVSPPGDLRKLLKGTPAQPFLEEDNGRMFDSIRSVTSSAVGALDYVGQQKGASFSVRQWVKGGKDSASGVLFMPYQASQIAALRSTISAWMRLSIFESMNQPEGDQRLWFVVDELDALGQIDGLKDALARTRKFGGRCVLGFQSIAQVSSTYGHGDAHTIVENCANTLILRCSASEGGGTARFASQLIGDREVLRTTVSRTRQPREWMHSKTQSEQFALEAAILPSQIEQLPDLAGYLKRASRPEWLPVRLSVPVREATPMVEATPVRGATPMREPTPVRETTSVRAEAREAWVGGRGRTSGPQAAEGALCPGAEYP